MRCSGKWRYSARDLPIVFLALVLLGWMVQSRLMASWSQIRKFLKSIDWLDELVPPKPANWTDETVYCQLDYCNTYQDLPRTFGKDYLAASYLTSIVLLALYFLWESAPCHRDRATEGVYKTMVVLLATWASESWESSLRIVNTSSGAIEVRTCAQWTMAIILWRRYADIDNWQPDFLSRPGTCRVLAKCRTLNQTSKGLERPPRGMRVTEELQRDMMLIVERSGDSKSRIADLGVPVLFAMFMLEELGMAFHETMDLPLRIVCEILYWTYFTYNAYWIFWVLFIRQRKIRHMELLLKKMLGTNDGAGLRYVLWHISVGTLLDLVGSPAQEVLMKALQNGMLDVTSKAVILDALQKIVINTRWEQEQVRDLITSCKGREATELKSLMDGSGGYQNLFKLVFCDVADEDLRNEILLHFKREAEQVRKQVNGSVGVKVLSDVDDTLLSSGGSFPAGCDASYPSHSVYPGCCKFYNVLDNSWTKDEPSCNLVFLSARPHVYKDLAEDKSYQTFNHLMASDHIHSLPTLLPGKLTSGVKAMLTFRFMRTSAWRDVGHDKYATFSDFSQLYPEYDFVFCGDDGQGDLLAGQLMLQSNAGSSLRAVMIHQVLKNDTPLSMDSTDADMESLLGEEKRLIFHKTYLGAAVDLHYLDPALVSAQQVADIAVAAVEDFDRVRIIVSEDWEERLAETEENLRESLARADAVLRQKGLEHKLPLLRTYAQVTQATELLLGDLKNEDGDDDDEEEWDTSDESTFDT